MARAGGPSGIKIVAITGPNALHAETALAAIEVADFLEAIAGGGTRGPDFCAGWEIQKVVDTAIASSRAKAWLPIA